MSHPCDGHACDHCYLCDVVGICCISVGSGSLAGSTRTHHIGSGVPENSTFRQAVAVEANMAEMLGQLVLVEALRLLAAPGGLLLPGPGVALELTHQNQSQEVERVLAPCHPKR